MSLKARLVKIKDVKVVDGHVVYDEIITHEIIFDFNYDIAISDVFYEYGEIYDDIGGTGLLLYLTLEGLEAFKETDDFNQLSQRDLDILSRIEDEINESKLEVVCFDVY